MDFQDKVLVCRDCGKEFLFSGGEQAFYAEKGFQNEPTRCHNCRAARKGGAPSSGLGQDAGGSRPSRAPISCSPSTRRSSTKWSGRSSTK